MIRALLALIPVLLLGLAGILVTCAPRPPAEPPDPAIVRAKARLIEAIAAEIEADLPGGRPAAPDSVLFPAIAPPDIPPAEDPVDVTPIPIERPASPAPAPRPLRFSERLGRAINPLSEPVPLP